MKAITTACLLAALSNYCHAQNKNLEAKYSVKLSNLATLDKYEESFGSNGDYSTVSSQRNLRLFHPVASFRVRNKHNNMHEFELTQLSVTSDKTSVNDVYPTGQTIPQGGAIVNRTAIGLRYEYIINFAKGKNSRWMPALGIAAMPYYNRTRVEPMLSNEFTAAVTQGGLRTYIVPRVNYAINSRFYVDVNIPVCITDMYVEQHTNSNPGAGANASVSTTNFNGAPALYSLRLGVGVRI